MFFILGILKFFGHFGHFNPSKMLLEYPLVAVKLAYNIESDNFTLLTVSLDVLGYIAETSNGKIALSSLGKFYIYDCYSLYGSTLGTFAGGEMNRIVSVIVERLTSLPTESRIRALNCLESLLRVQTDDEQVSEITRNWFSLMSDEPLGWITKYAKNPFHEIRLAGLGILRALSTQMWGHEVIRKSPGKGSMKSVFSQIIFVYIYCKNNRFDLNGVINNHIINNLSAHKKR